MSTEYTGRWIKHSAPQIITVAHGAMQHEANPLFILQQLSKSEIPLLKVKCREAEEGWRAMLMQRETQAARTPCLALWEGEWSSTCNEDSCVVSSSVRKGCRQHS